eukprot:m51a1_g653 hypothetical protein (972) ;mRNA; f:207934-218195
MIHGFVDVKAIDISRPSKKQDKFYNGKYKGHVVKIQVVVNNQGIPMDVQGFIAAVAYAGTTTLFPGTVRLVECDSGGICAVEIMRLYHFAQPVWKRLSFGYYWQEPTTAAAICQAAGFSSALSWGYASGTAGWRSDAWDVDVPPLGKVLVQWVNCRDNYAQYFRVKCNKTAIEPPWLAARPAWSTINSASIDSGTLHLSVFSYTKPGWHTTAFLGNDTSNPVIPSTGGGCGPAARVIGKTAAEDHYELPVHIINTSPGGEVYEYVEAQQQIGVTDDAVARVTKLLLSTLVPQPYILVSNNITSWSAPDVSYVAMGNVAAGCSADSPAGWCKQLWRVTTQMKQGVCNSRVQMAVAYTIGCTVADGSCSASIVGKTVTSSLDYLTAINGCIVIEPHSTLTATLQAFQSTAMEEPATNVVSSSQCWLLANVTSSGPLVNSVRIVDLRFWVPSTGVGLTVLVEGGHVVGKGLVAANGFGTSSVGSTAAEAHFVATNDGSSSALFNVGVASSLEYQFSVIAEATFVSGSASVQKSEQRTWLLWTLAALSVPASSRRRVFLSLALSRRNEFSRQLLCLACQGSPRAVARALSRDAELFRRFFRGNDERVKHWFAHFSFAGQPRYGSLALEHYLLAHREQLWERISWTGRKRTPGLAAQKRFLMMEIDVYETVGGMLCEDSAFWRSEQFRESLRGGEFLAIDYVFFIEHMADALGIAPYAEGSPRAPADAEQRRELLEAVEEYVEQTPLRDLLDHLIMLVPDDELARFAGSLLAAAAEAPAHVRLLGECVDPRMRCEDVLLGCSLLAQQAHVWRSLDGTPAVSPQATAGAVFGRRETEDLAREIARLPLAQAVVLTGALCFQWFVAVKAAVVAAKADELESLMAKAGIEYSKPKGLKRHHGSLGDRLRRKRRRRHSRKHGSSDDSDSDSGGDSSDDGEQVLQWEIAGASHTAATLPECLADIFRTRVCEHVLRRIARH